MATTPFEQILEEVKGLTIEEVMQLRKVLETILEDELNRRLLAEGVISSIPVRDPARFRDWKPITIQGKPLSETVIEDR
jgi:hypothetical protein